MNLARWIIGGSSLASAVLLVACGGGGGSSGNTTTTPPPTTQTALSLAGTAAGTGPAIGNAAVEAKCTSGSATGTTQASGDYSLSVASGQWPCLLRVTAADGSVLHGAAAGSGASATANITPATELVLANAAGSDAAAYYASFGSAGISAVTSADLAAAETTVLAALKAAGIDFGAAGDLLSGSLTAATSSGAGNAYAQALNALGNALTSSGTSLPTLASTLANIPPSVINGALPTSNVASLPAELLLKPAAANCAALRSGSYRLVSPQAGAASLASETGLLTVDAATLAVVSTNGTPGTWTANGPCRFLGDGGQTDVLVSPAGVLGLRSIDASATAHTLAIGFPEQSHTLAELAGSWNIMGMERNAAGTAYTGIAGNVTLDAAGQSSNPTWCQNDSTWSVAGTDCNAVSSAPPGISADSSGGFGITDAGASTASARAFAYRAGNGDLMMLKVDGDGSFQVRTRQRAYVLPDVGAVTGSWDIYLVDSLFSTSTVDGYTNTVLSVDTTAQSWTRRQVDATNTSSRVQTVYINNPRDGYVFRIADASTVPPTREFTSLALRGMGASALLLPSLKWFDLSVATP